MVGVPLAGLLLLLVLMIWVPMSANAYESTSGLTTPGMMQTTPTVDVTATMTALQEEKLRQEIQQLKNQNSPDFFDLLQTNSAILLSTLVIVIGGLIGFFRWFRDRRDARDKDLNAQAEERLKTAVTALGDEKESTQVGGAILLRSFLDPDDKKIYGRYYIQIYDLAVAYLSSSSTSHPSEDPDGLPYSSEDPNTPLPLTPLRQALIVVFKEAFPLARNKLAKTRFGLETLALNASRIRLDSAFLATSDLRRIIMEEASLRKIILSDADLRQAFFTKSNLEGANFIEANLKNAKFIEAKLSGATFKKADLTNAYLTGADLSKTNIEEARSLENANLCRVNGLTKEQLIACLEKGAIIDEYTMPSSS
jgi:hypothetical protein